MNHKYKPGDRVIIANTHTLPATIRNKTVTIKAIVNYTTPCYITNEYSNWIIGERFIAGYAAHADKVIITVKGRTTTASLYKGKDLIRSAEARCSPEDAFNFETGAHLAFSRLMPEAKSQEPHQPKYKPMQQLRILKGTKVSHWISPGAVVTITEVLKNNLYRVSGPHVGENRMNVQVVHEDDLSPL